MFKTALVLTGLIVAGIMLFNFAKNSNVKSANAVQDLVTVKIKDTTVYAELAESPMKREVGLMYRESLEPNHGMLFIFPDEKDYAFWMRNTKIPLDIIWINSNKEIVYISYKTPTCESVDPEQKNCPSYRPDHPAKYVLEVNSGWAEQNNVNIGDHLEF